MCLATGSNPYLVLLLAIASVLIGLTMNLSAWLDILTTNRIINTMVSLAGILILAYGAFSAVLTLAKFASISKARPIIRVSLGLQMESISAARTFRDRISFGQGSKIYLVDRVDKMRKRIQTRRVLLTDSPLVITLRSNPPRNLSLHFSNIGRLPRFTSTISFSILDTGLK